MDIMTSIMNALKNLGINTTLEQIGVDMKALNAKFGGKADLVGGKLPAAQMPDVVSQEFTAINARFATKADLSDGRVPAAQLPSYVDDVVEYADREAFPTSGEGGKIFIAINNPADPRSAVQYRWSGTNYFPVTSSAGSTDAVPEGTNNKYFTDQRALAAVAGQLGSKQDKINPGTAGQFLSHDLSFRKIQRAELEGSQSASTITEDATHRFMTDTERNKLSGVAPGATQNATDAQLRDRSTHTGLLPTGAISDFTEAVQDVLGQMLQAGTNVTVQYDDANNRLVISAAAGSTGVTDPEAVRDAIGVALSGVGLISVVANDAGDTITITTTATRNDTDANLRDRTTHTGLMPAAAVAQLATHRMVTDTQIADWTAKQDPITAALIRNYFSTGTGLLYDKVNGQFYINATDINTIIRSYLRSRDGFATGRVLSATDTDFMWVLQQMATGDGGTTPAPTTPAPTPVAGFTNPTDVSRNRINPALMTDVNIDTTAQLITFCTTAQTNKRGILTAALYDNGAGQIEQKGNWTNVMLTSTVNSVVRSSSSVVWIVTTNHTCEKVKISGITFRSTNTTSNAYAVAFHNELVGFKGLEYSYCRFEGTQAGNYNSFGIAQYSTTSNSGATSSDLYVNNCYFTAPRMGVEILSQGYDSVRLTNVIFTDNTFENTLANANEAHRMAISFSGLITSIYVARNNSINAKDICYEFVNVKYVLAEDNMATATLENVNAYSISDDGRNSTESIYIKGGTYNVTGRPIQMYDSKDVHFLGGVYRTGRGIDLNVRNCSFDGLDVQCTNLFNAEAIMQFGGVSNNNLVENCTLSSHGSAAKNHEPSYETVVLRSGTFSNNVKNNVLKQGKKIGGGYFTNGQVVNQGAATNVQSGNTVVLEP